MGHFFLWGRCLLPTFVYTEIVILMHQLPGQRFVYGYLNVPTTRAKWYFIYVHVMSTISSSLWQKKIITVFVHQNIVFCKGLKLYHKIRHSFSLLGDIWVQCALFENKFTYSLTYFMTKPKVVLSIQVI